MKFNELSNIIPWTQLKGFFLFPVFKMKLNFSQTIYKLQVFFIIMLFKDVAI